MSIDFSSIRKKIENIDYGWTKPQTYLILVPGLSILIQKIQIASTLPLPPSAETSPEAIAKSRKFADICKWHLRGSLAQMVVLAITVNCLAIPFLSLLMLLPIYELVDITLKSLKNRVTITDLDPTTGRPKNMYNATAFTIF
jgi:hypothetical protein